VTALQNALSTTSADKVIVFGYSHGALVAEHWLKKHLADSKTYPAPSPKVLSFVVIGNPTRAFGGSGATLAGEVWPQSDYQVIDIARQYDRPADFPNNPASPYYRLAVRNATRGATSGGLHDYTRVNIYDPANAVWTSADGNITYVLVPTQYVPILGVFAPLMPERNAELKAQIETAYIRPVPFPNTDPALPATSPTSALSTSLISDPTVAPEHTTVPMSLTPTAATDTTDPAPTATEPTTINRLDTGTAADDTTPTPTLGDAGNGAPTGPTIAAPAATPLLDTAGAATPSTTTATKNTLATSSTNGNDGATDTANETSSVTAQPNNKKAATVKAGRDSGSHR